MIDINFYEIDKTRNYCFQRHYAIKNIFCRVIYVLSISNSYKGNYNRIIRFLVLWKKCLKIKNIFRRKESFLY